jgi:hypothetical protein
VSVPHGPEIDYELAVRLNMIERLLVIALADAAPNADAEPWLAGNEAYMVAWLNDKLKRPFVLSDEQEVEWRANVNIVVGRFFGMCRARMDALRARAAGS